MATACSIYIVNMQQQAKDMKIQLANGSDFATLAKRYALCLSKKKEGGFRRVSSWSQG
jgi:peptidyl-prolyl cis-trans isomerase C